MLRQAWVALGMADHTLVHTSVEKFFRGKAAEMVPRVYQDTQDSFFFFSFFFLSFSLSFFFSPRFTGARVLQFLYLCGF